MFWLSRLTCSLSGIRFSLVDLCALLRYLTLKKVSKVSCGSRIYIHIEGKRD